MASVARRSSGDTAAGSGRSGRLLLRMPALLHDELSRRAEHEGVSLNQFIVRTLSASIGDDEHRHDDGHVDSPRDREPRLLGVALVVNLVVVGLAGLAAVGLFVLAWRSGL